MPNTARGHRYRFAIGKQTAEGTAQATPLYEFSMLNGSIKPTNTEQNFESTDADDLPLARYISYAQGAGDPTLVSDAEGTGLVWKLFLGSEAVTGAGDPWTHDITKTDAKPFATIFQMRPDVMGGTDQWERMVDSFIRGVELTATAGMPLQTKLDIIGKNYRFPVAAPTPTTDKRLHLSTTQLLTMIGATLKLDLDASPSVTQVRNLKTVVINASYPDAQWVQTDELFGRYLDLGGFQVGVTATAVFQDFNAYNATFFGDASPTTDTDLQQGVTNGSGRFVFSILPAVTANRQIDIQLPSLRWNMSPPEPDTSGVHIEANLTATLQKPASGEPLTVSLKNSRSTAY
jgi:tail tube protein